KVKGKETYQLILSATPFYAESGGQLGDTGKLVSVTDLVQIIDTRKENDLVIHYAESLPSDPSAEFTAAVDRRRRKAITLHHSATHLLHAALREVLGEHVAQKGSLVGSEQLRFDFSHFAKVSETDIARIELIVNEKIRENLPVEVRQMHKDEAVEMGAMALFGEKYGDIVRVVIMDPGFSLELCGGTHVSRTGDLGFFRIIHETAVAAGVRRIEAVAGLAAENYINSELSDFKKVSLSLNNPKDTPKAVEKLLAELSSLKKKTEKLENRQTALQTAALALKFEIINDIHFLGEIIEADSAEVLRKISTDLRNNYPLALIVLAASIEGRAQVAVSVSDQLLSTAGLDAGKIIKNQVASLINGGGGGQKTIAMAGGEDPARFKDVIETVKSLLKKT
ncbi:MAG: DHHA1 domain-containing protein, partial [Chitinophagaceae bacterium]